MPTKRKRLSRQAQQWISPAAVEAYRAGDFMALHIALGLAPWEPSPLPLSIEPLGIDPDNPPMPSNGGCWDDAYPKILELHRLLEAAVAKLSGES